MAKNNIAAIEKLADVIPSLNDGHIKILNEVIDFLMSVSQKDEDMVESMVCRYKSWAELDQASESLQDAIERDASLASFIRFLKGAVEAIGKVAIKGGIAI